jgi:hypothetical protein
MSFEPTEKDLGCQQENKQADLLLLTPWKEIKAD